MKYIDIAIAIRRIDGENNRKNYETTTSTENISL